VCYHNFPLQHQSGLYLDKVTQVYAGDDSSSNPLDLRKPATEAKSLKPLVQSLEYHHYDDLDGVLIRGENLWFLHQLRISHNLLIQPQNVSGNLIQFSCPTTASNTQQAGSSEASASVVVEAFSHFSSPITSSVPVSHKVSFVVQCKYIVSWLTGLFIFVNSKIGCICKLLPFVFGRAKTYMDRCLYTLLLVSSVLGSSSCNFSHANSKRYNSCNSTFVHLLFLLFSLSL